MCLSQAENDAVSQLHVKAEQELAAIKIQAGFRGMKDRQKFATEKERQEEAGECCWGNVLCLSTAVMLNSIAVWCDLFST